LSPLGIPSLAAQLSPLGIPSLAAQLSPLGIPSLTARSPLDVIQHVTLTIGRVAWRFGDEAQGAVVRPKASAAGEFEIHADFCTGPLLARLPLAPALREDGQNELNATISTSKLSDAHDLCIFATGDPRDGQWVLARVAISK
jgi:hexosaminidase